MTVSVLTGYPRCIPALLAERPGSAAEPFGTVSAEDLSDIERTLRGDGKGFSSLIKRYQGMITGIMWRFSRDIAVVEELVQDVFVQAFSSLKTYRRKAPFEFWLKTIATRVGYRYWRERKKVRERDLQAVWESINDKKENSSSPEAVAEFVHALLEQLKAKDRLVMTLYYFEQCSMDEIAKRTGFTSGMVKMRVHRARKKLGNIIQKEHSSEIQEWIQKTT